MRGIGDLLDRGVALGGWEAAINEISRSKDGHLACE